MEWTSVLVITLRIPKKKARQNTGKQRGRAAQQKITDKVSCFIVLIVLKKKNNDSPLDFYRHFLLTHEVRA